MRPAYLLPFADDRPERCSSARHFLGCRLWLGRLPRHSFYLSGGCPVCRPRLQWGQQSLDFLVPAVSRRPANAVFLGMISGQQRCRPCETGRPGRPFCYRPKRRLFCQAEDLSSLQTATDQACLPMRSPDHFAVRGHALPGRRTLFQARLGTAQRTGGGLCGASITFRSGFYFRPGRHWA